eukprot:5046469-Alexandrium_andersonii.AAC.1
MTDQGRTGSDGALQESPMGGGRSQTNRGTPRAAGGQEARMRTCLEEKLPPNPVLEDRAGQRHFADGYFAPKLDTKTPKWQVADRGEGTGAYCVSEGHRICSWREQMDASLTGLGWH